MVRGPVQALVERFDEERARLRILRQSRDPGDHGIAGLDDGGIVGVSENVRDGTVQKVGDGVVDAAGHGLLNGLLLEHLGNTIRPFGLDGVEHLVDRVLVHHQPGHHALMELQVLEEPA